MMSFNNNIIPVITWEELEEVTKDLKVNLLVNGLPTGAINSFYSENKKRQANNIKLGQCETWDLLIIYDIFLFIREIYSLYEEFQFFTPN